MTLEELQRLVADPDQWERIGSGNYNKIFRSYSSFTIDGYHYTGQWVVKKPIPDEWETEEEKKNIPDRAVRKWQILNPGLPAIQLGDDWVVPYLGAEQASDEEVSAKILEIYRETREFVLDLFGEGNCLKFQDEVICVDVDLSLRRGSIPSEGYLKELQEPSSKIAVDMEAYFKEKALTMPKSVMVSRTLLYLVSALDESDIKDSYITPNIIDLLGLFRALHSPLDTRLLDYIVSIDSACFTTVQKLFSLMAYVQDPLLKLELCLECLGKPLNRGQIDTLNANIRQIRAHLNTPGTKGLSLLHAAAFTNQPAVVELLLSLGADVNQRVTLRDSPFFELAALEMLSQKNASAVAKHLLNVRPEIPAIQPGVYHWVHFAAAHGLVNVLEHILATAEYQQDQLDEKSGYSFALFRVPAPSKALSREHLILNVMDERGNTPLDYAIQNQQEAAARFLRQQGATAQQSQFCGDSGLQRKFG